MKLQRDPNSFQGTLLRSPKIKKMEEVKMKKNDKIKVHMYSFGKEIETRNFDKVFTVYKKNGKLGIDYNTEKKSLHLQG